MTRRTAVAVSALTGFVSLSYEIVWFRAFSFATGGSAAIFGILLGVFLFGLAMGARIAQKTLKSGTPDSHNAQLATMGFHLLGANLAAFLVIPVMSATVSVAGGMLSLEGVGLAAAGWGTAFPFLSQLAVNPDERAGQGLSDLYVANILGSVTGTIITGFILMDLFPLPRIAVLLAIAGLGMSAWLIFLSRPNRRAQATTVLPILVLAAICVASVPWLFDGLYEKLLYKRGIQRNEYFSDVVENRSGVIAVTTDREVFGSGAYDGWISTDLVADSNNVVRAYAVAALHPKPREVLVIGLSTGAWTQVLAHMPGVEHVTVVEINPGYLRLIGKYPQVSSLLTNPKVHIVIDDGRRWLARNPRRQFDAVVMNTTFHWRAHTTNLLSREFVDLAGMHLRPGGILYYNTTGSDDALKTGLIRYPYGMRFRNFVTVSKSPIRWNNERFRSVLHDYSIDGRKVFDLSRPEHRKAFERVSLLGSQPESANWDGIESRERALQRLVSARIVTDDNMLPEWESAMIHGIVRFLRH